MQVRNSKVYPPLQECLICFSSLLTRQRYLLYWARRGVMETDILIEQIKVTKATPLLAVTPQHSLSNSKTSSKFSNSYWGSLTLTPNVPDIFSTAMKYEVIKTNFASAKPKHGLMRYFRRILIKIWGWV